MSEFAPKTDAYATRPFQRSGSAFFSTSRQRYVLPAPQAPWIQRVVVSSSRLSIRDSRVSWYVIVAPDINRTDKRFFLYDSGIQRDAARCHTAINSNDYCYLGSRRWARCWLNDSFGSIAVMRPVAPSHLPRHPRQNGYRLLIHFACPKPFPCGHGCERVSENKTLLFSYMGYNSYTLFEHIGAHGVPNLRIRPRQHGRPDGS